MKGGNCGATVETSPREQASRQFTKINLSGQILEARVTPPERKAALVIQMFNCHPPVVGCSHALQVTVQLHGERTPTASCNTVPWIPAGQAGGPSTPTTGKTMDGWDAFSGTHCCVTRGWGYSSAGKALAQPELQKPCTSWAW